MRSIKGLCLFLASLFISLLSIFQIPGCADNPTSLGKNFLPSGDTLGIRIFDSYTDTMQFVSINIRKAVNTSSSLNMITGLNGNYSSKALIKFTSLSNLYDSATVNSAILQLKYNNYYFPTGSSDSLGNLSFNIYTVEQNFNYQTVTVDSISASSFGTVSQGNYSGVLVDTQTVYIPLNNQLVQNWLAYTADTSHGAKNYGIALIPNSSSAVLKSFYSANANSGLKPLLKIIVTKNAHTDTLTTDGSQTVSLVNTTFTNNPEIFHLQAGVSYIQTLRFTQNKIPSNATINDAQVILTLDSAESKFSTQTTRQLAAYFITDTSNGIATESVPFYGNPSGNLYYFRIILPFQRWLQGQTNWGMEIIPRNLSVNLDLFAFYNITASDPAKRPRVIVKYTLRSGK